MWFLLRRMNAGLGGEGILSGPWMSKLDGRMVLRSSFLDFIGICLVFLCGARSSRKQMRSPSRSSPKSVVFSSRSEETHIKTHAGEVRITHPAHPLRGQSFRVVPHQKQKKEGWTEIELSDGERRYIRLDWTDQVPKRVTLPEGRFLPDKLLWLRQELNGLLSLLAERGTLPPKDRQLKGGSDELPKGGHMVNSARKATDPDCGLAGAASAGPTQATRKGGE